MDMNLRHLECFLAVAHHGHFGHAAQSLHLSTPGVSKNLRKLEDQLGVVLVDRADSARLTPAGSALLPAAQAAVEAARSAYAFASALRREQVDSLAVGFVAGFAGAATRPILDRYATVEPGVALELTELSLSEQSAAVRAHRVDASFVRAPIRPSPQLRLELVLREPRLLVVARDHRLAGRSRVVLADFADEPMLRLSDELVDAAWSGWWAVDPRPHGKPVRYGPTVTTVAEFLEAVSADRAVGITTLSLMRELNRSDLSWCEIEDVAPSEVYLCTRRESVSRALLSLRRVCAGLAHDHA